jgi:hypothetical protein
MALKKQAEQFTDPAPVVRCAHDVCSQPAKVRYRVNGALVNLCLRHYASHTGDEAKEFCRQQGLETTDQRRAFCVAGFKALSKGVRKTPIAHWQGVLQTTGLPESTYETARKCLEKIGYRHVEREPGQDDEEMAA